MICSCPKCSADFELDHIQIPEDGAAAKCSNCKLKIKIVREPFARMAYYKASQKYCSRCGNHLGHTLHCPSCYAFYPDFFAAVDSAAARRQARERDSQDFMSGFRFSMPDFKSGASDKTSYRQAKQEPGKSSPSIFSPVMIAIIIGLLVIVTIGGGGYFYYARHKAEQIYMETFFKTLYSIKSGVILSNKSYTRFVAELKAAQNSGQRITPQISSDEELQLTGLKAEIDKLIKELNPPAEKFAKPYENLTKLNDQFKKSSALAISPPATLQELTEAITNQGEAFSKQSQALRSSITEDMAEELKNAKIRYNKVLSDF